jgi:uncharacterized protein (TIGR03437 family)
MAAATAAQRQADGVSWLHVSPMSGTTPATLIATADSQNLAPGRYSATLRFRVFEREYTLPVTHVVPDPTPRLDASPNPVEFNVRGAARGTLEQTLLVRNLGGVGTHEFSVQVVEGNWLSVSTEVATIVGPEAGRVTVRANVTDLFPGGRHGLLRVTMGTQSIEVPVSLYVGGGPAIGLSFRGVQFEARQGQGILLTRDVAILNPGDGRLGWTAEKIRGGNWLSFTPAGSVVTRERPGKLTLRADASNLPVGTYYAAIEVSDPLASNSPQFITVVLNVVPASAAPSPFPNPAGLVFLAVDGQPPPPDQEVSVFTSSIVPASFTVAASSFDGASWLSVQPMSGASSTESAAPVRVSVNHARLQPGVYTGSVSFSMAPRVVRTVNVSLIVAAADTVAPAAAKGRAVAAGCAPSRLAVTHTGVVNSFFALAGWPVPVSVRVHDDCGAPAVQSRVVLTFSNGDPPINMTLTDPETATFTATWTPSRPGAQTTMAARATQGTLSGDSSVSGAVPRNAVPILTPKGTLHNLNPRVGAPLAPGTVVQIMGENLAANATIAGLPLPVDLSGASVIVGAFEAPLYYASPTQINAQLPFELDPNRQYPVIVSVNGALTTPDIINLSPAQPGVAAFPDGRVIAQHTDFSLVTPDAPARPGETLIIYLAGMGRTDQNVGTGKQSPSAEPLARVRLPVTVTIGGEPAEVLFAGLTPGAIGLYQINLVVPAAAPPGELRLVVRQNGIEANVGRLPVRPE